MMTEKEIYSWLAEHNNMKYRRDYIERGNRTLHICRYENGDVYEHQEVYTDIFHKSSETLLNHVTVDRANWIYHNFGWKREVATV
ncbi:MAG: hypothetical protein LUC88_10210 [Prevotella sp.]|nr:hypothetical protein [Prevotella sp.]